jgi:hypothetical protein
VAFVTINADLTRTADLLERLTLAVERLVFLTVHPNARHYLQNIPVPQGMVKPAPPSKPAGPEAISYFDEEAAWSKENEQERRQSFRTPEDNLPPPESLEPEPGPNRE